MTSSVTRTSAATTDLQRCAVCKIDLKGRFVYVDEEVEELLGYTKEELFGKPMLEFLDEPSQTLVDRLLSGRNHYESFFDTCSMTIINRGGRRVVARAVVSLNFVAGNPVNFQFILDATRIVQVKTPCDAHRFSYAEYVDSLLSLENLADFKEFLSVLRRFTGACQGSLYVIDGDELEPRCGASDNGLDEFSFESIPETTGLHLRVAQDGQEYSFTDESSVRLALENENDAPSEFVTRLDFDDAGRYLLRLAFSADIERSEAQEATDRAKLGSELARRLLRASGPVPDRSQPPVDVMFTVGFLDSLGIGAFLTDATGKVKGFNRTFAKMIDKDRPSEDYCELIRALGTGGNTDVEATVAEFFSSPESADLEEDLRLSIVLPSGEASQLVVARFSVAEGDLSACFVLIPTVTPEVDYEQSSADPPG